MFNFFGSRIFLGMLGIALFFSPLEQTLLGGPATTRASQLQQRRVDPENWADSSTPNKAMFLLHIATLIPNLGLPVDQYCYGEDDFTRKFIEGSSMARRRSDALRDAVKKRFGEEGMNELDLIDSEKATLQIARQEMQEMGDQTFAVIEKIVPRIDGDQATIGDGAGMRHFKKTKGKWLVGLRIDDKYRPFTPTPAQSELAINLLSDMTRRVENGEFADAKALKTAMEKRQQEGMADLEKRGLVRSPSAVDATQPAENPAKR